MTWRSLSLGQINPRRGSEGKQSRDFTFVENVVDANLLAAEADGVSGMVLNVAMGGSTTLNAMIELIEDVTGRSLAAHYGDKRPGDFPHFQADIGLARKHLGFDPRFGLRDGLLQTVEPLAAASSGLRTP